MNILKAIYLLVLAVATGSCIREPGCVPELTEENVEVLLKWPDSASNYTNVFIECYAHTGDNPIRNFLPATGGHVFLPGGMYDILVYTKSSGKINFRGMEAFSTAEAWFSEDTQPDMLFCGSIQGVEIQGKGVAQQIEVVMKSQVKIYPFRFREIVNMQYVNRIRVSLSGISSSLLMAGESVPQETVAVNCPYTLTSDGFYGAVFCFGHGDTLTDHLFTVYFELGDQVRSRTYNVTRMLNKNDSIDIYDKIVFEPLNNGGLKPGVGDWDDDSVVIPI